MRTKVIPQVRFYEDDSLDRVYDLEKVFDQIQEQRKTAPMIRLDFAQIVEELRGHESFLLTSHANPDGDAIGSVLGLYHLLRAMGKKEICCALADPIPKIYKVLPGAEKIIGPDVEESEEDTDVPDFEVVVLMDVAKLERIGEIEEWIDEDAKIILLDHHLSEEHDATLGFSDSTYASTTEIMYELWQAAGLKLTREAAHCLYVGQITDTGAYRYSNTNPRSHRIAAGLLESGIDHASITADIYDTMSLEKFALLKLCFSRMTLCAGNRAAYSWLSTEDLHGCGAKKEHLDGLVNFARNLEGVEVGVLFYEVETGKTKVSLRSQRNFNSAKFLEEFGGGGHAPAAGATIESPLEECVAMILHRLEETLGERS